jgi:hypothetical protein
MLFHVRKPRGINDGESLLPILDVVGEASCGCYENWDVVSDRYAREVD